MERYLHQSLKYIMIMAGSVAYAAGISLFLDPNSLAPGGVTGISIILNRFTPVSVGTWSFLINVPVMIIGLWKLGRKMMISTVLAVIFSSVWMNIFRQLPAVTEDKIPAAIIGGICVAAGIGLVFKAGGTTGGIDVIIRCIRKKNPFVKTGTLFLISDMSVIILSAIVFKNLEVGAYAGISAFVCSAVLDFILYGRDEAKLLFIISDKEELIVKRILSEIDVGVTELSGKGAYTGKKRRIIMCVMKKHRMPKVSSIVSEIDDRAFMIISSAGEIYGEGYKSYHNII